MAINSISNGEAGSSVRTTINSNFSELDTRVSTAQSKADAAYVKPGTGIPSSDLASAVQTALTDARTPTAHKTSHATGGSDALTPSDIGAAASGAVTSSGLTMATARLLGRTTASSGAVEEISIGSGLSMTSNTLSTTGSGSPSQGAANSVQLSDGAGAFLAAAGITTDGVSVLSLGVPGTAIGGLSLANATSGTVTIRPPTGALGSAVITLPGGNSTLATLSGNTFTGSQRVPVGSSSNCSFGFSTSSNTGLYSRDGYKLDIAVEGTWVMEYGAAAAVLQTGIVFGWGTNVSPDVALHRDAAGTLAQRNGTNNQTFRVYNTFTDASNFERAFMRWSSNVLSVGTEKGGSGSARALSLLTDGVTRLTLGSAGGLTVQDGLDISTGTTTGTKIGTATGQKLGFWNATPIEQPTTAVAEATFVANAGGTTVTDDSTFDGYTLQQIAKALRNAGLLA